MRRCEERRPKHSPPHRMNLIDNFLKVRVFLSLSNLILFIIPRQLRRSQQYIQQCYREIETMNYELFLFTKRCTPYRRFDWIHNISKKKKGNIPGKQKNHLVFGKKKFYIFEQTKMSRKKSYRCEICFYESAKKICEKNTIRKNVRAKSSRVMKEWNFVIIKKNTNLTESQRMSAGSCYVHDASRTTKTWLKI